MLFDLGVWLAGLILFSPILIYGLAWARINRFYLSRQIQQRQKFFYLAALVAVSVSTVAYVGYWTWRISELYHGTVPFVVLLSLERLIYVSRVLSMAAIPCLLIGRGPYRILVVLATLWVILQLWVHDGIVHWA